MCRENHVGERRLMNCGVEAIIIGYNNSNVVTVEFEDGVVRHNVRYSNFKRGSVLKCSRRKVEHVDEFRKIKDGRTAVITEYRGINDITVRLEGRDKLLVTTYSNFLNEELD